MKRLARGLARSRRFLVGKPLPWIAWLLAIGGLGTYFLWPEHLTVNTPLPKVFSTGTLPDSVLHERLRLPPGFAISSYATGLGHARVLIFADQGELLYSTPRSGEVWLLEQDRDGDGRADGRRLLLEGLNRPHGLALMDGWLYVAESDSVGRIRFDQETSTVTGHLEPVADNLPDGGNHWSRTIGVGPDGWIYLTIGSSCNLCEEQDKRRAAMHRFRPDGSDFQTVATGLRNSVDFAWGPDGNLYATDNGRDFLGDDLPPEELNRIVEKGFYGWPYAWGNRQPDPHFSPPRTVPIQNSLPPVHSFPAHSAPLGIVFLGDGSLTPAKFRGAALVALHGSWNRTRKSGYQVVSLHWDKQGHITQQPFLTGFEIREEVIGRPAFLVQGPDQAIYLSDDYAGIIYRIHYRPGDSAP